MRTRIKICGITRVADAEAALAAGADAIGMVFYDASPRRVSVDVARAIGELAPPLVDIVGVFVDPDDILLREIRREVRLDVIQFHGDESAERCAKCRLPYLKALRVRDDDVIADRVAQYPGARGVLLDTYSPAVAGGTGQRFIWRDPGPTVRPIILAGGLSADNVAEAMRTVRPFAVDVSSGVESAPGIKSHDKMRRFVDAVQAQDAEAATQSASSAV
ncbi:MAG: phosphoribosylanthranilate isomerase [Gammaproteobacteria bacterium]|nr:phosphoribosylanthranilate isomerase [Gammaproteobacteria bacterium]MDH3466222.1 phosphoribosylanthranilate isomerase [Gammaproteobacteria bacterium]